MSKLAVFGVVLGLGAIALGNVMHGGLFSTLVNLPALVIVFGGTLGAVLVQTPGGTLAGTAALVRRSVSGEPMDLRQRARQIADWSRLIRREGMLGLEKIAERQADPFIARGLALVADGAPTRTIREILEVELDQRLEKGLDAAGVFSSLGGYAPTIGLIGAVLGLIQVMGNLTDPGQLGPGIATAFVATIYGVAAANLLFLPVAERLKALVINEASSYAMIVDGLVALAEGEHPRVIETRLAGYLGRP
ncbi:MAG: flagellar motor protein [Pseudomonadales bacterium]|nr:flagellar motor protein [Pseudomonadales bacterium]